MNYTLETLQVAEAEFGEAISWYEHISPELAKRFKHHVTRTINQITENPHRYTKISSDVRRAIVDRFPYNIYFYMKNYTIVIFGIIHSRRSPALWHSRLH